MPVYEIHGIGVFNKDRGPQIFPIDIVRARSDRAASAIAKGKAAMLRGWDRFFKLYRVPYYHTGLRAWRDDELTLVCDLDLGPAPLAACRTNGETCAAGGGMPRQTSTRKGRSRA